MPFIEDAEPTAATPQIAPELETSGGGAPFGQLLDAAMIRENTLGAMANRLAEGPASPPDATFDPWRDIGGYEDYAASFMDANSPEDVARIKGRIDGERKRADMLASGGAAGVMAEVIAGVADPINLIPIGGQALRVGRMGERFLSGAARVGLAAGAAGIATEAALQGLQETRTGTESAINVAAQTLLGGILGGGIGLLAGRDLSALSRGVTADTETLANDMAANIPDSGGRLSAGVSRETGDLMPAGAAVTSPRTLETESIARLGNLPEALDFSSPTLRTQTSPALETRVLAQDLAEQPLMTKGNLEGMASPVAVESLIRQWQYPLSKSLNDLDDIFVRYRLGRDKRVGDMARIGLTDMVSSSGGKMGREQFMEAVGMAMRRGDLSDIPEVAEAARKLRKTVFDPLKDRAIELGLLPEDVDPGTAASYLMRQYNHEKIAARRNQFSDVITDWYAATQAEKAEIQGAVKGLDETRDSLLDLFDKTQAKIAARESKMTQAERQLAEVRRQRQKELERTFDIGERFRETEEQAVERRLRVQQREGGIRATRQDARLKELNDRLSGIEHDMEALERYRDDIGARLSANADAMEEAVSKWKGKSARDAQGAIKRRDAKEATRGPEQPRLAEADKAILRAARRILAADTNLDRESLQDIARQTIDRIQGTPAGRLSYDVKAPAPGFMRADETPDVMASALHSRAFMIPDHLIEDFLESDVSLLTRAYVRTMAPDVTMAERGWLNFDEKIKRVLENYERLRAGVTDEKELLRLDKRMTNDIRDIKAIWERLRGTYALPSDPHSMVNRAARVIRDLNYVRLLGGMTISSIPDVGRIVMQHGFTRVFKDGFLPLVQNMKAVRLSVEDVRMSGEALDMLLDTRTMAIADIMDDYGRYSKFERGLQTAAGRFGIVSLMAPWNTLLKSFVGVISQTRSLRAIEALNAGAVAPDELARLAAFGVDARMAKKIGDQFTAHGEKRGNLWWANTDDWTDREAREAFRAGISKEINQTIVTPGQEKPLWMSHELGRILGQFKTFSMASMQRVTMAGLQQRDMATLNGTALMIGMGALAYYLKTDADRLSDDPAVWVKEGVDRSGITGWMFDANNIIEKATRGSLGVSRLLGQPMATRYASRGVLESLLGPTAGLVNDVAQVTGSAASMDWRQTDTHALRRMMPLQNLIGFKAIADAAEEGLNASLGVPK